MNIENDIDAGDKMKYHSDPLNKRHKRHLYTHTKIGCYNDDGVFIGNIRKHLIEKINGRKLLRYLMGKYGWTEDKISLIDWAALEEVLRKQSPTRQKRLAQIMHNWQNVGTQKDNIDDTTTHKCPTGCDMVEDHGHYLICQNEVMTKEQWRLQEI